MGNTKKFDGYAEITRKRLVREVNNDMCHNYYYEFRFRVYTNETHYFKGNFVLWFDVQDVGEFFDKDVVTKKEIAEYADEVGCSFLSNAPSKNVSAETMRQFYDDCRKTIEDYNRNR